MTGRRLRRERKKKHRPSRISGKDDIFINSYARYGDADHLPSISLSTDISGVTSTLRRSSGET